MILLIEKEIQQEEKEALMNSGYTLIYAETSKDRELLSSVADAFLVDAKAKNAKLNYLTTTGEAVAWIKNLQRGKIYHADIKRAVCDVFQVNEDEMLSGSRRRNGKNVVGARQLAQTLARILRRCSLREVAENYGCQNHATVLHSIAAVKGDWFQRSEYRDTVRRVIRLLVEDGEKRAMVEKELNK